MAYILKARRTTFKSAERSPENEIEDIDVGGKFFNSVEGVVSFVTRNLPGLTLPTLEELQTVLDAEGAYSQEIASETVDGFINIVVQPSEATEPQ